MTHLLNTVLFLGNALLQLQRHGAIHLDIKQNVKKTRLPSFQLDCPLSENKGHPSVFLCPLSLASEPLHNHHYWREPLLVYRLSRAEKAVHTIQKNYYNQLIQSVSFAVMLDYYPLCHKISILEPVPEL